MCADTTNDLRKPVPVRFDYLDALRGLAVMGVVAVHSWNTVIGIFPGSRMASAGRYGVQLFFVVSAYTIFLTLDRARWDGWRTWGEFYIRRAFRILPMFWLGLAFYAFVPGRGPMYANRSYTALDYGLTAILQHGWHPALYNALVPGGWSIAAEGTFYLLVPLCFRVLKGWRSALVFLFGSIILAAFLEGLLYSAYTQRLVFVGTPGAMIQEFGYGQFFIQLPIFVCGIVAYRIARSREKRPPAGWPAGAALLVASVLWLLAVMRYGQDAFLPERTLFAFGFVGLILGLKAYPTRLLVNPITCYLGRVSYSIYLLHFVVLRLECDSLNTYLEPTQQGLGRFAAVFIPSLAGSAALAWLSYRGIERPCIDLGARLIQHRRTAVRDDAPAQVSLSCGEWTPAPRPTREAG